MLHLIYDTETTGQWKYDLPDTHESQPRMVQMGAILADDDARVIGEINLIVKPEGFVIPPDATEVHGITQELAMKVGLPLVLVMGAFSNLVAAADICIAFNNEYDRSIVKRETTLLQKPNRLEEARIKHHCEMKEMTPICKIPKPAHYRRNPNDPYKWPSLDEAYQHVFGEPFKGTRHNAMEDVRATARLYYAFFWKRRDSGTQLMPGVANTKPAETPSML
jgi:DNA polymerase-3 subunit epsilon